MPKRSTQKAAYKFVAAVPPPVEVQAPVVMDGGQAWLATLEEKFWAAHTTVLDATGAREYADAAASWWSSLRSDDAVSWLGASVQRFTGAVDWSEPLLRHLGTFHAAVWVSAIAATWGGVSDERINAVFFIVGALMLSGVCANSVASRHPEWLFPELSARYTAEQSVVMMVVYLLPLLVLLMYLQLRLICRTFSRMRQAKRAQLHQGAHKAAQQ
ncbi:Transmembrane protein 18 [Novymonas esmeraldas]|uniref:Transmembrane protein 18 n=1 Tax=Novymonas esmeraldas TaxID=1808958 RepID=A0AAW0EXE5_9TRYP